MARPSKVPIPGIEKTAILMTVLGEEKCFDLMKQFKDAELRKLLSAMGKVKKVPLVLINAVLKEFLYELSESEEILFDDNLTSIEVVKKGLGESRAKQIFGTAVKGIVNRKTLPVLENIDEKELAEFLVEEHPQTIALIVAHMESSKQRSMIKLFPDAIRTEVLLRMANLGPVDAELIDELEDFLQQQFTESRKPVKGQYGGVKSIADLIESLDKKTMNSILSRLENKDPLFTEEIRQHMFTFTDIIKIDNKGIQTLLRSVPSDVLMLALKTAPQELRERIFSVMSERASKMMREDLEALGPQKVSDIEKAQKQIVGIVKQLEEEGKLVIGVGEENEVIP